MRIRLWGTRGSIAVAGAGTVGYGGDTSCVEVSGADGRILILDGGSGIRALPVPDETRRVDILLSHLHMDHVQGLPFFPPLLDPEVEVHVWGPMSSTRSLRQRISRYLSPPLFPVRVRDLANVSFHDVTPGSFELGSVTVRADLIAHPGPTLGYRLEESGRSVAYLPDHEPALGRRVLDSDPDWVSGHSLASGANVLIHDAQYEDAEYLERIGWGHTSISQLAEFARQAQPDRLVTFHHDPSHDDVALDHLHDRLAERLDNRAQLVAGKAGLEIEV